VREISINGDPCSTLADTVADLITEFNISTRGVAVAVNGTVIPRSEWSQTTIASGDRLEIVTAAAGG